MSIEFVTTKDNHDPITLSVDTHGMKATTSIFFNSHLLKMAENSFKNCIIGLSNDLDGSAITVVTQVYRNPREAEVSIVNYFINGGQGVHPDNPNNSTIPFDDIAPIVSHFMMYYFVKSKVNQNPGYISA